MRMEHLCCGVFRKLGEARTPRRLWSCPEIVTRILDSWAEGRMPGRLAIKGGIFCQRKTWDKDSQFIEQAVFVLSLHVRSVFLIWIYVWRPRNNFWVRVLKHLKRWHPGFSNTPELWETSFSTPWTNWGRTCMEGMDEFDRQIAQRFARP